MPRSQNATDIPRRRSSNPTLTPGDLKKGPHSPTADNGDDTPLAGYKVCYSWTLGPENLDQSFTSRVTLGKILFFFMVQFSRVQSVCTWHVSVRIK